MTLQIDCAIKAKPDRLVAQKRALRFMSLPAGKRNSATAIYHSIPGKVIFIGAGVKNPGDLAGTPWVSGISGYLAISGHLPFGDGLNKPLDALGKRASLTF